MKISIQNFAIVAIGCFVLLMAGTTRLSAQTAIYTQNFDGAYALPTGWATSAGSWTIDSTNSSTGYTGASGLNNVVVQNQSSPSGHDTLYSKIISTVGYTNISADWAARNTTHFSDSGSNIKGFYWSTDAGLTWNQVTYTENGNNSTWSIDNNSTVIALPSAVSNNPSVQFAWIAHIYTGPSGTYRIDDFNVDGSPSSGIPTVTEGPVYVYCINSSVIQLVSRNTLSQNLNVEVYDITGNIVNRSVMTAQTMSINASAFSSGIYFVRASNDTESSVSKIFIK
jgi:hypothetical protein